MNFIPSRDHIPSLDNRVKVANPILLHSGEAALGYGVFGFLLNAANRIADIYGKGESLMDLYKTLPSILKLLANPIFSGVAIMFGFWALWHQGRNIGSLDSTTSVVLFDSNHRPVSGPRTRPALKRAGWASLFAVLGVALVGSIVETPIRDWVFLRTFSATVPTPSVPGPPNQLASHAPPRKKLPVVPHAATSQQATAQQQSASSIQPPVFNIPTNQSSILPGSGIYERVQQVSREISDWQNNYIQQIQSAESSAMRRVNGLYHSTMARYDDPDFKKLKDEAQKRADEEVKEAYRRIDDTANNWILQKQGELQSIHRDAISHMQQAKPDIWTPNALMKDQNVFGDAMKSAASGAQFADLENKKINNNRFEALHNYFEQMSKQLGDYPDT